MAGWKQKGLLLSIMNEKNGFLKVDGGIVSLQFFFVNSRIIFNGQTKNVICIGGREIPQAAF